MWLVTICFITTDVCCIFNLNFSITGLSGHYCYTTHVDKTLLASYNMSIYVQMMQLFVLCTVTRECAVFFAISCIHY